MAEVIHGQTVLPAGSPVVSSQPSAAAVYVRGCAPRVHRPAGALLRAGYARGRTVERVAQANLPTEMGLFHIIGYRSLTSGEEFVALARGELRPDRPTLVRIHSQCLTGDVFGSTKCDCGRQLHAAMERIAGEECGVILYQQQEGRGIGIINKIRAYALQDEGADTIEANERLGLAADLRKYEQCAEIFLDLGLRRVRVLSNNPEKVRTLEQSGLEVVARVGLELPPTDAATHYLRTKKERMGHLLELV
ncbi:MAG: GTP cyclohydrolase II [Acidobacteriota bacterium]|nr:GTP cyclohydrolase II [Acidobacteriota bacterium]